MSTVEKIELFLKKRPNVKAAYGYGSGVFKQSGYTSKDKPQLDLILVVDDLKEWHTKNIRINSKDYSLVSKFFFKSFPIKAIKGTTGIAYISNIKEDGNVYKYGTIEEKDLEKHLLTWDSFYLPGRFQKTFLPIKSSKKLDKANEINRDNALFIALLTLPEDRKNLLDLYTQLCGLSYLGDTRMKFAENPRKVLNIVEGSFDKFKEIYGTSNKYFETNKSSIIKINYDKLISDWHNMPDSLLEYINEDLNSENIDLVRSRILEFFTDINKGESFKQTLKGIGSTGPIKSIQYASAKVAKKLKK